MEIRNSGSTDLFYLAQRPRKKFFSPFEAGLKISIRTPFSRGYGPIDPFFGNKKLLEKGHLFYFFDFRLFFFLEYFSIFFVCSIIGSKIIFLSFPKHKDQRKVAYFQFWKIFFLDNFFYFHCFSHYKVENIFLLLLNGCRLTVGRLFRI